MRPAAELAVRIGRELLKVSRSSQSARTWSQSVEHSLHGLGFRHSMSPSLVARVIDPFLLNHHSLALEKGIDHVCLKSMQQRKASQLLCQREHLEDTGAHVVLLRCVADAKEAKIGIKHMKWIKEVSPSLVHTISSDLSASFCSSSDPDSILPFIPALEHT